MKVTDRRWWARGEGTVEAEEPKLKPKYVEELEAQIAEKNSEIQQLLTKYRGASDEFDQARARLRKELSKDVERGRRSMLVSFLEVLDNLDRAIEAAGKTPPTDALLQGVEMVRRQFLSKLESLGVKRINSEGAHFDPVKHEAVSTVPAAKPEDDGRVVGIIRHGYTIGDEVLRPASVAVAKV